MRRLLSDSRIRAIEAVERARPSREALEALTMQAMRMCEAPRSQLTLVTGDRQFTLAISGSDVDGHAFTEGFATPLSDSICRFVIETEGPLSITDTQELPIICDMNCVTSDGIRAYLGHPISSWDNEPLGSLCVIDYEPRAWDRRDRMMLASLAASANVILLQAVLALEDD